MFVSMHSGAWLLDVVAEQESGTILPAALWFLTADSFNSIVDCVASSAEPTGRYTRGAE